jgi:gamma-glutamyl hercynylcysteine S-oxide synthase
MRKPVCLALTLIIVSAFLEAQSIKTLNLGTGRGLAVVGFSRGAGDNIRCNDTLPLFTFELNDTLITSLSGIAVPGKDSIRWISTTGIEGSLNIENEFDRGWKASFTFRNTSARKHQISNVVPLGAAPDHVYIISAGLSDPAHRLSRSQLFRPGLGPVGVVLPDNAWELGLCDVRVSDTISLTALARRTESGKADVRRFRTILEPGGFVRYDFFIEEHAGDWRDGLRMLFQQRWLYDLKKFDNSLFERADLSWIRHSYLLLLQFAWDQNNFDALQGKYRFDKFISAQDAVLDRKSVV